MTFGAVLRPVWTVLSWIEGGVDAFKRALGRRDPKNAVPHAYFGFGTTDRLYVTVRALCGPGLDLVHPVKIGRAEDAALAGDRSRLEALTAQGRRQTLAQMWQRFDTDEVRGAVIEAPGGARAVTGREGFAELCLPGDAGTPAKGDPRWRHLRIAAVNSERADAAIDIHALVPGADARFGIVSDIDDTIVKTNATRLWRMIPLVLTRNASGRTPFPGVAAFYKALERGGRAEGGTLNPVFYVSSSPWNLYDLLVDYMALQSIPLGPIFLRDFGLTKAGPIGEGHGSHKGAAIRRLFETYPRLPFVLIGDSGERDPRIYAEIAEAYPGRVEAVYLRAVTTRSAAAAAPHVARLERLGVPVVLAAETASLAAHAAALGLIPAHEVEAVRAASAEDA